MKASKSFDEEKVRATNASGSFPKTSPLSRSLDCAPDEIPERQFCTAHPKIALGEGEACPRCAIKLMKRAAKKLERRAAELEHEREERLAERQEKRRERKSARRSVGARALAERSQKAAPSGCRPPLKRQFSLGQVAQPHQMDARNNVLVQLAKLQVGEGAWIKRSDAVWTYATLKARDEGPDATLKFTVNERGCTKTFPLSHWAEFVRAINERVADADLEMDEDEKEIDLMLSDCHLNEPITENEDRTEAHALETSLKSFASVPTVGSTDDAPVKGASKHVHIKKPSSKHRLRTNALASSIFSATTVGAVTDMQDDDSSQGSKQEMKIMLGIQEESAPPVRKTDAIHRVSFESSRDSIVSDPSYSADCDEDGPRLRNKTAGTAKARKVLKRASTWTGIEDPADAHDSPKQSRSSGLRMKHRVSWSADINKMNDDICFDMDEAIVPFSEAPRLSKKPKDLDIGETTNSKRSDKARSGKARPGKSFHSALKSIHRRCRG